jgi:hypothetical protein
MASKNPGRATSGFIAAGRDVVHVYGGSQLGNLGSGVTTTDGEAFGALVLCPQTFARFGRNLQDCSSVR